MKCYLAILLLVATVSATSWPAVIEAGEDDYEEPFYSPSLSNQDDTTNGEARPWQEEGESGMDDAQPSVLIRGIQEQLMEDLLRMEQDLLFIRRLLGQGPSHSRPHQPPVVLSPFPWRPPVLPPGRSDPFDNNGEGVVDEGDDSPWFNFPSLGFDRPIFHDLPNIPSVIRVDELPDNYDNSTHQIHEVNGSRVEVNTTTNKQSGDGFNTFFHHQVIHIRPGQDGQEPEIVDYSTTTPEEEEGVEEEVQPSPIPTLPEVENEVNFSGYPETPILNEVPAEELVESRGRSLSSPNNSPYILNRPYNDEEYDKLNDNKYGWMNGEYMDDDMDDEVPEPKLLGDTRVNHMTTNEHQGATMVDPEAEVFDLALVNKEARRNEDD